MTELETALPTVNGVVDVSVQLGARIRGLRKLTGLTVRALRSTSGSLSEPHLADRARPRDPVRGDAVLDCNLARPVDRRSLRRTRRHTPPGTSPGPRAASERHESREAITLDGGVRWGRLASSVPDVDFVYLDVSGRRGVLSGGRSCAARRPRVRLCDPGHPGRADRLRRIRRSHERLDLVRLDDAPSALDDRGRADARDLDGDQSGRRPSARTSEMRVATAGVNVGFVGLGRMGQGIAGRVLGGGHALTVFNRTRDKTAELAAAGAAWRSPSPEPARAPTRCSRWSPTTPHSPRSRSGQAACATRSHPAPSMSRWEPTAWRDPGARGSARRGGADPRRGPGAGPPRHGRIRAAGDRRRRPAGGCRPLPAAVRRDRASERSRPGRGPSRRRPSSSPTISCSAAASRR